MSESLEIIVEIIAIVSFVATVVNYTIVKPLRISIDTLTIAVNKLEELLHKVEDAELDLRQRVVAGEVRIDDLLERVDTLESYHKQPIMGKKR